MSTNDLLEGAGIDVHANVIHEKVCLEDYPKLNPVFLDKLKKDG